MKKLEHEHTVDLLKNRDQSRVVFGVIQSLENCTTTGQCATYTCIAVDKLITDRIKSDSFEQN